MSSPPGRLRVVHRVPERNQYSQRPRAHGRRQLAVRARSVDARSNVRRGRTPFVRSPAILKEDAHHNPHRLRCGARRGGGSLRDSAASRDGLAARSPADRGRGGARFLGIHGSAREDLAARSGKESPRVENRPWKGRSTSPTRGSGPREDRPGLPGLGEDRRPRGRHDRLEDLLKPPRSAGIRRNVPGAGVARALPRAVGDAARVSDRTIVDAVIFLGNGSCRDSKFPLENFRRARESPEEPTARRRGGSSPAT